MGIINWLRDFFHRQNNRCEGCNVPLVGLQRGACSEECALQARAW